VVVVVSLAVVVFSFLGFFRAAVVVTVVVVKVVVVSAALSAVLVDAVVEAVDPEFFTASCEAAASPAAVDAAWAA